MTWIRWLAVLVALCVCVHGATVVINGASKQQSIDGFGFSSAWCGTLSSAKAIPLYETLGMSILRIRIDENHYWDDETNNAKRAHYYGAKVLGSPWSPPPAWNSNGKSSGGSLLPSHYADYAAYLNEASKSIGLDFVSLQNEPDYGDAWTMWSGQQFHDFLRDHGKSIDYPIVMPESFNFNDATADPTLNDAATVGYVAIVGGHIYGSGNSVHQNALNKGKHVWQTENYVDGHDILTCLDVARQVNQLMNNQFSAYIWWWVYDATDPSNILNRNGTVYKNGYTLGQFAKFLPTGSQRLAATYAPTSTVSVTAYQDAKGGLVIIAINSGTTAATQAFTLSGLSGGVSVLYVTRTSPNEDMADVAPVSVQNGAFSYVLAAQSINTFHQTVYPKNLAAGKAASQSSVGSWCNGNQACSPSYAVDSIYSQTPGDGGCAHTASNSGNQWWRVDLGTAARLSQVKVYLRSDCCTERDIGYAVYLSNSATAWDADAVALGTISAQADYQIYVYNVPTGTAPQRYVEVRATNQYLAVCEVVVIGSTDTNACATNPCTNGGTCTATSAGATCLCPGGFGGDKCQTCTGGFTQFVNSDAPNNDLATQWGVTSYADCQTACLSTAGCVMFTFNAGLSGCWLKSAVGAYTSASGFTAGICSALLPTTPLACASSPCVNGGTCNNVLVGGYSCACPAAFTGATCATPASVAQLKVATMSGVGSWCNGNNACSASYAVDNNYAQSLANGYCAHSGSCTGNQYWRVDLGAAYSLTQVVLYLRTDCCTSRAVGYGVYLSNSATAWDSSAVAIGSITAQTADQIYTLTVPASTAAAQYVEVRAVDQCLTICEAAVMGTLA